MSQKTSAMASGQDPRTKLSLSRLLRPLRLAFLLPPGNEWLFRQVVEVTCCLWGGIQNPIVPVFGRRPRNWEHPWRWPGGREYANGLLAAFEPDFIVEAQEGLADFLRLSESRVISMSAVVNQTRDPHIGYGVSMMDVFRHAYDEEFQYVRRERPRAFWVATKGSPPTLFESVAFGAYPRSERFGYLSRAFADVFEPEALAPGALAAFDALARRSISPVRATRYGLGVQRGGWRSHELAFLLLDPRSIPDLIEFWNLRAWGQRCIPVPAQHAAELSKAIATIVTRENVPLRGNPAIKHHSTLLKGPSVGRDALFHTAKLLSALPERALVLQEWMPRTWNSEARAYDLSERSELVARSDDVEAQVEERRLRFDLLPPDFEIDRGNSGLPRWANSLTLHDYSGVETGLVYPEPGKDLGALLRAGDITGGPRALREGIAVVSAGGYGGQFWELPDGQSVVREWFSARKLTFAPSAAGRTALEVCRSLGGLRGLHFVKNLDLLRRLETASRGGAISHAELLGILRKEHGESAVNWMRALLTHNVLQIGLMINCAICDTEGWFSLDRLSETLRCSRCLRDFSFPGSTPPQKWAYRTQGPFSLAGYANGAYSTLLALRFLGPTLDGDMSWFPGGEIGRGQDKYELDFVAFWRKRYGPSGAVRVLIGECKTLDAFKSADVSRLREVGRQFPESFRVFATLRAELTSAEQRAIRKLVNVGRRRRGMVAPVLVLTATELLADQRPPYCYERAGGRLSQYAKANIAPMVGDDGMLGLCRLTQQIHLGLQPGEG